MIFLNWAKESAQNAVELSEEAEILLNNGRKIRAYYLAHMATEEASKAILLKAMVILKTPESELKKINNLLRDHRKKIEFLIVFAESHSNEITQEIGNLRQQLISHINNLKNNTMYVSLINNKVITPSSKLGNVDVDHYVSFAKKIATYAKRLKAENSKQANQADGK
jgi:AbiV family abortive infection protein